jgi:hypothetical protein
MADVTDTLYAGEAMIGYGAQFLVGQDDGSPESFTAIPDVMSIQPGALTTGTTRKTHLRSPDRHHEYLATLRDSDEITINVNYRPNHGAHKRAGGDGFSATHNLPQLWIDVREFNCRLVFPEPGEPVSPETSGTVLDIAGVITEYTPGELQLEELIPCTIKVRPLRDYSSGLP